MKIQSYRPDRSRATRRPPSTLRPLRQIIDQVLDELDETLIKIENLGPRPPAKDEADAG